MYEKYTSGGDTPASYDPPCSRSKEQRCRAILGRPPGHGLQPPTGSSTGLPQGQRLAVWRLQCTFWSRFSYKNQYSHPREQRCRAILGRLSRHGLQPPARSPAGHPQEQRLAVWRFQFRCNTPSIVALLSNSWSRFRHPQEQRRRARPGRLPQHNNQCEATGTFDIYFSSSPGPGLLVSAVSSALVKHPEATNTGPGFNRGSGSGAARPRLWSYKGECPCGARGFPSPLSLFYCKPEIISHLKPGLLGKLPEGGCRLKYAERAMNDSKNQHSQAH